jgi:uncharacterized membrane protein required for colicin V production
LGGLKYIVDAVFQIGKAIVNTGFEILRKIIGALFDVVQAAVYPIIAAFDKLINVVNGQGKDPEMRKDFVSGLNKVEAGVVGGINSVESGIVNAMNSVQVPLDNWFNNTIKSINTTADKWLKGLDTAISNLQKTLYDRLDKSAQEINTLLTNVEKAIPSALEWYEKQTASVFTNTMKSSGETVVQTKTTATATKTLVDKVGTGNQYAAEYNKQLAAANTALGGAGTIAKGLADNSKQITKTIGDAAGGAKLTGKDIVKSINSLKVTSQSDSTDTYTNSSTKTIAANGDMTLADAMSINRVGHTYAYFHSAEMAGLASGGYVKGPTKALIGEGSEPELVAPLSTGAKLIAGEITNILGNKQGDSRPIINVHVEVKGPVYGIDDFERKFDQLMKKEMTKWSWR